MNAPQLACENAKIKRELVDVRNENVELLFQNQRLSSENEMLRKRLNHWMRFRDTKTGLLPDHLTGES